MDKYHFKRKGETCHSAEISFFAEMAACGSSGSTLGKEEDLAIISGVLVSGKIDLDKDNIGNINLNQVNEGFLFIKFRAIHTDFLLLKDGVKQSFVDEGVDPVILEQLQQLW